MSPSCYQPDVSLQGEERAVWHLGRATEARREGRFDSAVDAYREAASDYLRCGMARRARAALTIAWRLAAPNAGTEPTQVASTAAELTRIDCAQGFIADAEQVARTAIDSLVAAGHVGLALQLAEWAVQATDQNPRFASLYAYVLERVGIDAAENGAPTAGGHLTEGTRYQIVSRRVS